LKSLEPITLLVNRTSGANGPFVALLPIIVGAIRWQLRPRGVWRTRTGVATYLRDDSQEAACPDIGIGVLTQEANWGRSSAAGWCEAGTATFDTQVVAGSRPWPDTAHSIVRQTRGLFARIAVKSVTWRGVRTTASTTNEAARFHASDADSYLS
jgi:hypothetical protein